MQRKCILLFLIIVTCMKYAGKAAGKIQEERFSYNTLYADEKNRLWIGTANGLYQWKNSLSVKVPLSSNINITAINSMNDYLILGTLEGKIYTYNRNTKKLVIAGDMNSEISDIQKKGSMLCIASKGKGYVNISPYEISWYNIGRGLTDNFIYKLVLDEENCIWSSSDKGINILQPHNKKKENFLNSKIPDRLVTCFVLKDNIFFCGTQRGDICKINLADSSFTLFDHSIWKGAQVNDLKILDQSLAIATEFGAYILDLNGKLTETVVANKAVKKIETDREANVWFCGDRILISSLGEQISMMRSVNGNPVSDVHAIIADKAQAIYFTPDQGLMKLNISGNVLQKIAITLPEELVDITSIYLDDYGKLWVGTSGKGLYKVDTSTLAFTHIAIDSSVETSGILSITGDREKIWVASLNGVWYSINNTNKYAFKSLEDEYGKKKYYVYQVKKDSRNNLWLATDGQGILKVSNGRISDFTSENNIKSKVFYSIEEDGIKQMWFNAYNDGLYCVRDDTIIHLTPSNGLSSNDILSMMKLKDKYIVASSSEGADIINIHDFSVTHYNFESLHLTQTPETNSIAADTGGNIYIGSNAGILKFFIPSYKTYFIPESSIEEISVMERNTIREKHIFCSEENYFRFRISSNFNTEQTIYYRYKLKGLSEQWNQTIDKEVVFPRLNPAEYVFILESSNNRNFLNATEDTFAFTILNPYWKQNWFILLVLSAFGISFYYYIRFREKRIGRVQQLEKEKAIAEFETLKHQVSPHFLFNSFNTLIQVIDEDKEKAIEYTQMLSDFYRSLIAYRQEDLVTLEEELKLLDKYIYLQKMRFGDSLLLLDKCTAIQKEGIEIPPLTLQLLAENAIKHNTVSSMKPLTITIQLSSEYILISNNLNEKISKEAGENIGLQNIKNRFKLFSKHHVEVHKTDKTFEVKLPILRISK